MESHEYKDEINIILSPQAMGILSRSKHSVDEFKEWVKQTQKFSMGGHNVTLFLEKKAKEFEKKQKEEKNIKAMNKANNDK